MTGLPSLRDLLAAADVCTGNNNCVRDVVFILYSAFRTEYFQTLVIAVYCLTAVVNNTDCAVFKGQRNNGGIDITFCTDCRIDKNSTLCVYFGYFTAS